MKGSFSEGLYAGGRTISAIFTRAAIFLLVPSDFFAAVVFETAKVRAGAFSALAPWCAVVLVTAGTTFPVAAFFGAPLSALLPILVFIAASFFALEALSPLAAADALPFAGVLPFAPVFLACAFNFADFVPVALLIVRLSRGLADTSRFLGRKSYRDSAPVRPTLIYARRPLSQARDEAMLNTQEPHFTNIFQWFDHKAIA
ncbi:MAG: hypothetical protein ABWZ86_04640 [Hyphomicrobium sp.]